ncbi:hypothetical protein [Allokutzneria oryzae]|uniref:Uncharacterized protein n=1 Tax=Allokutzneria oryzae TaxID=1378989 RepID=A0ABV5ZRS1_9PSEU
MPEPAAVNNRVGQAHTVIQVGAVHGDVRMVQYGDASSGFEPSPISIYVSITEAAEEVVRTLVVDGDPPSEVLLSNAVQMRITVEALTAQAVVLEAARPVIVERHSPRLACVHHSYALGEDMHPVWWDTDLTTPRPRLRRIGMDLSSTAEFPRRDPGGFPYSVSMQRPMQFWVMPRVREHEVEWQLELDWICRGRRGTFVIDTGDGPFRLYPEDQDLYELHDDMPWRDAPAAVRDLWERHIRAGNTKPS